MTDIALLFLGSTRHFYFLPPTLKAQWRIYMNKIIVLVGIFIASIAQAGQGLVIHTAEFGVGKFHRMDNKTHAYAAGNAWTPYVLQDGVDTKHALTKKN